jgi:hypothetical protein
MVSVEAVERAVAAVDDPVVAEYLELPWLIVDIAPVVQSEAWSVIGGFQ